MVDGYGYIEPEQRRQLMQDLFEKKDKVESIGRVANRKKTLPEISFVMFAWEELAPITSVMAYESMCVFVHMTRVFGYPNEEIRAFLKLDEETNVKFLGEKGRRVLSGMPSWRNAYAELEKIINR